MDISIDKNLVEFKPESDAEVAQMDELWKLVVDCVKFNKKLVPVGEFIPGKSKCLRFVIE